MIFCKASWWPPLLRKKVAKESTRTWLSLPRKFIINNVVNCEESKSRKCQDIYRSSSPEAQNMKAKGHGKSKKWLPIFLAFPVCRLRFLDLWNRVQFKYNKCQKGQKYVQPALDWSFEDQKEGYNTAKTCWSRENVAAKDGKGVPVLLNWQRHFYNLIAISEVSLSQSFKEFKKFNRLKSFSEVLYQDLEDQREVPKWFSLSFWHLWFLSRKILKSCE